MDHAGRVRLAETSGTRNESPCLNLGRGREEEAIRTDGEGPKGRRQCFARRMAVVRFPDGERYHASRSLSNSAKSSCRRAHSRAGRVRDAVALVTGRQDRVCCFCACEDAGKTARVDGSGAQYGAFLFHLCTLEVKNSCAHRHKTAVLVTERVALERPVTLVRTASRIGTVLEHTQGYSDATGLGEKGSSIGPLRERFTSKPKNQVPQVFGGQGIFDRTSLRHRQAWKQKRRSEL